VQLRFKFVLMAVVGLIQGELLFAQTAHLDRYIQEGLDKNLGIKQEQSDRTSVKEALKEARSRFFPSLWFTSRYTRAAGGRSVTIPVDEILGPIFQQLALQQAQLDQLQGINTPLDQPPILEPQTINIMPEKEQETKFQLTQPLFAPALLAYYKMNKQLLSESEGSLQSAALRLIRDIRLAYYTCLQAKEGIAVYEAACKRSSQQWYAAQKLFANGMLTETSVIGAEAEHARNETALVKSRLDFTNATKALNILVNYPLDKKPELEKPDSVLLQQLLVPVEVSAGYHDSLAKASRPELKQLAAAIEASRYYLSVEKSGFAPTVAAAFEGGVIGDRFEISDRSTFYTASILLRWELFSGLGRVNKVKKAHAAIEKIKEHTAEVKKKIAFEVDKVLADFTLAQRVYRDSELQYRAAQKNYESVFERFEQGLCPITEMTEAGELLTKAEAARSCARYDLFKQQAHVRYAVADDIDRLPTTIAYSGGTNER